MYNSGVARVPCARGLRTILMSPLTKLLSLKWKIGAEEVKVEHLLLVILFFFNSNIKRISARNGRQNCNSSNVRVWVWILSRYGGRKRFGVGVLYAWRFLQFFQQIRIFKLILGLGPNLFVKVPRPGDSEGTFSVFESSCHLLLPV